MTQMVRIFTRINNASDDYTDLITIEVGSIQINNVKEEDRVVWNNDDTAILNGNDTDYT